MACEDSAKGAIWLLVDRVQRRLRLLAGARDLEIPRERSDGTIGHQQFISQTICSPSQGYLQDEDDQPVILDRVGNAPVSNSYPIEVVMSRQLLATCGPGVRTQHLNRSVDA
jgi:hypothetical protein